MRVLLVPNTGNAAAVAAAVELALWCTARGLQPALATDDADACGLAGFAVAPSDIGSPDLAVALGGDGTILKAVHLLGDVTVPLLGVKFGRLGFLSGASATEMRDAVEAALSGDVRIERRATLRVEVTMSGRSAGTYRALNEVSLNRGQGRLIGFEVRVDDSRIAHMRADGVIVATATGSTAYALSAGGPIVAPGFGGMLVVPVAPHTISTRALLTEPSEAVELVLDGADRGQACIAVDGTVTPCRSPLERIVISRGEHDVALVKLGGRDFYRTVSQEFFGGE